MNHIFSWSRCLSRCSTLHNDLPFLLERKKIKKIEKLVTNLYDKSEYVIHIKNLKQALKHGLILKKVHRVIKFNQKDWLKPMEKMENVRKYSVIKLVTTKKKKEIIMHQDQIIVYKIFCRKFIGKRNEKNANFN